MYIIIIGCGRLGSGLAMELSNDGHDVVIVDKYAANLQRLRSGFNGIKIKGVEIDNDTLMEAGIDKADIFLAMTPADNINIMASQIAKNIFKVPKVIARIFDPSREFIYRKLGLQTISPTELGINIIKNKIIDKKSDTLITLNNDISIEEITINKLKFKNVLEIEDKFNCSICAVWKNGEFMLPNKNELFEKGNKIVCSINKENKEKLVKAIMREKLI
ncbi:TrkA family potassium uptake protein [Clostridium tagluense]|uniref:potassium channel family protein n=1 Tax=Clostridium tagluense TaxID=360422 RepID=UPI001C0E1D1E|nr:TrkA family potassium uptake protein [Clostridium tagluense]MBU3130061.1 TrkA family potassium uptake protein [Clostridium tagluense]MCB2313476.1 TrkA family potassium uptake protein [Clostridium tagluense]MCB2318300.1 TrkA family potassium uptake protein [Clostridium tagluense]MCB2323142.1 TrkA family potassium uptake protein [Clostridium tagluense]MCB2328125.1 TrkA family potassium uptake protein [Clostridium tagluense]